MNSGEKSFHIRSARQIHFMVFAASPEGRFFRPVRKRAFLIAAVGENDRYTGRGETPANTGADSATAARDDCHTRIEVQCTCHEFLISPNAVPTLYS